MSIYHDEIVKIFLLDILARVFDRLRLGWHNPVENLIKPVNSSITRTVTEHTVSQSLRPEQFADSEEKFAQLRKWADPKLPDPYGDSYSQRYTIADLKRLFDAV